MLKQTTDGGGRVVMPEIPPQTVNDDHLSDAEKIAVWSIYRETPAGLRQRLIDLQGVEELNL
ncbi:MAG: hypothetical protein AAGI45_17825 [Cyanobacteria bacterium P01_H01_bin.26]